MIQNDDTGRRVPSERCKTCGSFHDGCSVDVCPYGIDGSEELNEEE